MTQRQGSFVWYELMTPDVDRAVKFYGDVVGWGTQSFTGGDAPYTVWTTSEGGIGGVLAPPPDAKKRGVPPHWCAYVSVDDVDAATRKATSLGATTCVPPMDIPTVGRFSVIHDPQGATLALFKGPGMPPPADPVHGRHSWNQLTANDWQSEFRFYEALLGWEKLDAVDMGPMGTYQIYGQGGRAYGGMMSKAKDDPGAPRWLHYVWVDDLDAALGRVRRGGGTVAMGPQEVPGGTRIGHCIDPQGAAFALHGK